MLLKDRVKLWGNNSDCSVQVIKLLISVSIKQVGLITAIRSIKTFFIHLYLRLLSPSRPYQALNKILNFAFIVKIQKKCSNQDSIFIRERDSLTRIKWLFLIGLNTKTRPNQLLQLCLLSLFHRQRRNCMTCSLTQFYSARLPLQILFIGKLFLHFPSFVLNI